MPANYFHVTTGAVLSTMESLSFADNASKFAILFGLQFVALIPTFLKSRIAKMEEGGLAPNPKRTS